jgi:hypothetical protein
VCTMVRDQPKLLFVLWTGVNSFTQSEQYLACFFYSRHTTSSGFSKCLRTDEHI